MHTPDKKASPLTRRRFLATCSASAAGAMAFPAFVANLRGQNAPSRKLNIAGIGVGGQGASDLREFEGENIVALCDVDRAYAARTFKKYDKARQFSDLRKMLDEMKEIDAVVIATPDHLHAFAALEAIKRGKHVYCEKPLTHTVAEARMLAKAAREAKVATQMGNQGQASEDTRRLCENIWAGAIGKVREAHVWTDRPSNGLFNEYWPQGVEKPKDTPAVPETLDWDLWLGPAPQRAFHPAYLPFKWRGWWDFGTGALGDIGCHALDSVFRALKLGAPLTVQAASTRVNKETYPLGSMVTCHFPARTSAAQTINEFLTGAPATSRGEIEMPPCRLTWYDGGLRPPRPEALPNSVPMGDNGRLIIGDEGFILANTIFPEARRKTVGTVASTLPRSPGHHEEWIRACKGGPKAGANFDWAGPLTESVLLGNVALRLQLREDLTLQKLHWDGPSLRFTNLEEANQFVTGQYREGWHLGG
jgi:predicted dehydrogenase